MLPVVGAGSSLGILNLSAQSPAGFAASAGSAGSPVKLSYKTLGKTGLKVTSVGMGCMITSDPSVVAARGRSWHHLLRYRARLSAWQQRAHGGRGAGQQAQTGGALHQDGGARQGRSVGTTRHQPERAQDGFRRHMVSARQEQPGRDSRRPDRSAATRQAAGQGALRRRQHAQQPAATIPWMVQKGVFDVVLSAFNFSMDPAVERRSMRRPRPAWAWWR